MNNFNYLDNKIEKRAKHSVKNNALKIFKRIKWKFENVPFKDILFSLVKEYEYFDVNPEKKYSFREIENPNNDFDEMPFMLVRPTGLNDINKIRDIINQNGISINNEFDISDYRSLERQLGTKSDSKKLLAWLQILESKYEEAINNKAKVIIFNDANSKKIDQLKKIIRRELGLKFYKVMIDGKVRETCITPVHSPDTDKIARELRICLGYADNNNDK